MAAKESSHRLINSEHQSDRLRPARLYKTIENLAKCRRRALDLESIPVIRQYPLSKFDSFGDCQLIKLITSIRRGLANSRCVFEYAVRIVIEDELERFDKVMRRRRKKVLSTRAAWWRRQQMQQILKLEVHFPPG